MTGSKQGDALLAAVPGMLSAEDDAAQALYGGYSSTETSPMPSQFSTRPPSASAANHRASSCGGLGGSEAERRRTVPSISPLDGGGGPGLSNDFHLGVISSGGHSSSHGGGVSWS